MAHPSLFPFAPSAPRVRIAFLITVGLLLGLLFSAAGRAEAETVSSLSGELSYASNFAPAGQLSELVPNAAPSTEPDGHVVLDEVLRALDEAVADSDRIDPTAALRSLAR